jgi:hypothetical protein
VFFEFFRTLVEFDKKQDKVGNWLFQAVPMKPLDPNPVFRAPLNGSLAQVLDLYVQGGVFFLSECGREYPYSFEPDPPSSKVVVETVLPYLESVDSLTDNLIIEDSETGPILYQRTMDDV